MTKKVTSMLVMDVGDEMWWQLEDIGDGFHQFGHLYSFLHERKLQSADKFTTV